MNFENDIHISGIMNDHLVVFPFTINLHPEFDIVFCMLPAAEIWMDWGKLLVERKRDVKKLEGITAAKYLFMNPKTNPTQG